MKFSESGLPDRTLIETAFNHSYAQTMAREADSLKLFKQQTELEYSQNMSMLDTELKLGGLSAEEHKREREMLERMRDQRLKIGPQAIRNELERSFVTRRVAFAKELAQNSDAPTDEAISAALLVECVRSPLDFRGIEAKFGNKVSDIIANVLHMEAYANNANDHLPNVNADTKRVYTALQVANLDGLTQQVERLARAQAPQMLMFPPGQEQAIFDTVKALWGNDKKLDKRLTDSFNRAANAVKSPFRIELDGAGAPELVKGIPPVPPNKNLPVVKGPKNNGSIGGDVF